MNNQRTYDFRIRLQVVDMGEENVDTVPDEKSETAPTVA